MNDAGPTFIDLFSGAGGFLRGFLDAGFKPLFSVEMWDSAIETHKFNYPKVPIIEKDIRQISDEELTNYVGKVDVVVGGPPCQGFSTIGKRLERDPRNELVFEYIRFVKTLKPKVFLMENVRGLISTKHGEVKKIIESMFRELGYDVYSDVLCAADYGVPQLRNRVFFIGIRLDLKIPASLPKPLLNKSEYKTVGEAIMDLVGLENQVPNHIPMKHNPIVEQRIS